MALFSAFCGGSNTERSRTLDDEISVNLFPAKVEGQGATKQAWLQGTPGVKPLATVATVGNRGIYTQDGRTWTVVGDTLYPLTVDPLTGAVTPGAALGTIPDDGHPVSWASNGDGGSQLAICGGGVLKILGLVTNVLSAAIVLPLTNAPRCLGYLDGYFVLSEVDSLRFWFSNLENGLIWDALDFATRSTASDRIVALACANNRVWLFGSETSEAYEDVGDANNPFAPIKGSLFQIGIAGAWTLSLGVSTMRWVGRSSRGGAVVYRLDGYAGTRISTHAIEASLASATTLTDAEGLTYEQDGHLFYAITCPSLGVAGDTLVIDETAGGAWHHRRAYQAALGRETQWRVRGHAYVGQTHVVGSWDSGSIWALDLNTFDDDGQILRARRRAPYLGAENAWATIDRVELGCELGVGLTSGQGSDPQVELRVSKDSGKTWFSMGPSGIGKLGESDRYGCSWTRLGRVRIDRLVLEVVITDGVKRAFGPGLWISATPLAKAA
jgi:hypothetical protein